MTTTARPLKLLNLGRFVLTRGVADFIDTGVMPYEDEPRANTLGLDWRRHWITVCVSSHAEGCWGDACPEDAALNDEVFSNACGGRLMSTWHRSGFPKLWIITEAYGTPDCYTCALWPDEY